MSEQLSRTEMLLGKEGMERLSAARVAVFGIGGVGSYAAEALARSGIGTLDLVDGDKVSLSNLNRQLYALHSTLGIFKVEAAKQRISDIDSNVKVNAFPAFFTGETSSSFDFSQYDYVIDAVDMVSSKLLLAQCCQQAGTPLISSMGAGNKLDPTGFRVADIYETSVCPLARVMRHELRKLGISKLKVVYSQELPAEQTDGRRVPASVAFVPAAAGLILAGEVIKTIAGV